jgi:hypothetical protein
VKRKRGENVMEKGRKGKEKGRKGKENEKRGSKRVKQMQNREELRKKGHDGSQKMTVPRGGINIVFGPKYRPLLSGFPILDRDENRATALLSTPNLLQTQPVFSFTIGKSLLFCQIIKPFYNPCRPL